MNEPLSERQKDVLALIRASIAKRGYPPTRSEISAALGASSPNAAEQHLRALARKGYIEVLPIARGIRVLKQGRKSAPHLPFGHLLPAARGEEKALPSPRAAGRGWRVAPGEGEVSRLLRLPLIGRVAAGVPILAEQSVEDEIGVDANLFHPRPDFLLRVHGESMRDAGIHDGDWVVVQHTSDVTNGQIVVARIDDEATVKTFERNGSRICLLPANPDFQPIEIDADTPAFVIEGRVVGVIRKGL